MCVLLGLVLHRNSHFKGRFLEQESISCLFVCPFPHHATRQQHPMWWRRSLKLFLGLRPNPASGDYPLLGVAISIGNFWGPLKQTNKQSHQVQNAFHFKNTNVEIVLSHCSNKIASNSNTLVGNIILVLPFLWHYHDENFYVIIKMFTKYPFKRDFETRLYLLLSFI